MKDQVSSRRLRLERLETRSLLAGGIFISTVPIEPTSRDVGVAPVDVAIPAARDVSSQERLQPANDVRGNADSSGRGQRIAAPSNVVAIDPTPTRPIQDQNGNVGEPSPTNNVGTQGNAPLPVAVDAVLASLQVRSENGGVAVESVNFIDDAVVSTFARSDSETITGFNADFETSSTSSRQLDVESIESDGFIERSELWKLRPLDDLSQDAAEPWQLSQETLPRLQRILESHRNSLPRMKDVAQLDRIITDCFDGPGGLIAVHRGKLPALTIPLANDLIGVQLESSVGLHRSLDLIAAAVVEPISGPMLDAIMSSIEEISREETQPLSEPTPLRVSALVDPGTAAIVVGTAAIASRRKRKYPPNENLMKTLGP